VDLFAVAEAVPASGPVPRTLAPGVIWDEAAEIRFADGFRVMRTRGLAGRGYSIEDAARSMAWAVEAELHRKLIRREVEAGIRCGDDVVSKREIFARWRREYGQVRADEIARLTADYGAKQAVLKW
jgi:hypothetical protein